MDEHDLFRGRVLDRAAGILGASEEAALERHLAGCPDCARESERWAGLAGALRALPAPPMDPARVSAIATLAAARRREVLERRRERLLLVGLAIFGWLLFLPGLPLARAFTEAVAGRLGWRVPATAGFGIAAWWSLSWLTGLALLPLLRLRARVSEENRT